MRNRSMMLRMFLRVLFLVPLVRAQCLRQEVNPYFDRYQEKLGDSLKCCDNKPEPPTTTGQERCGSQAKACLWGQQKCGQDGTIIEPESRCDCINREWTCRAIVCPTTAAKCCDQDTKPDHVDCGRSGCACCSDGKWVTGNSGPTLPPGEVCKRLDLTPSEPCPVKCCDTPKPTDVECGRSGCHCCSNGEWLLGNSGPTLDAATACGNARLEASKPCQDVLCCDPKSKPSDFNCGLSGCNCCSDGKWVTGNSGPTLPPGEVCKRLDLTPSVPCRSK